MGRTLRKLLRAVANHDPSYYDMYADSNEAFFARFYLDRIRREVERIGLRPPATVLDAGCQAGRLMIPLAQDGFRVTGVDTSGFALRRAKRHARTAGVDVRCLRGDISELIGRHPEWAFDLVLCAEVLYMGPEPQALLGRLAGVVRPGGLLCVSHRPQAYYLLEALRRGAFEAAVFISRHQEGPLSYYEPGYYNWQTGPQLQDMYASLGLTIRDAFPVDRFAWLSGLDPARLTDQQREELLALERSTPLQDPLCARYIGVIAQRAGDG